VGSCEPNGICVADPVGSDFGAHCECDPYYWQARMSILECTNIGQMRTGEPCGYDQNCESGRCLKYAGETEGYCTSIYCFTEEGCLNHSCQDTNEMCCVELAEDYRMCLKIAEGYECGDGTGTRGDSCTGTLESACAEGHDCIRLDDTDPFAICARPCDTDADCAECQWSVEPSMGFECATVTGGARYCLLSNKEYCSSDADCLGEETCAYQGQSLFRLEAGICGQWGPSPPGAYCEEPESCSSLICIENVCRAVCSNDTQCAADEACVWLDRHASGPYCVAGPRCQTDEDCAEGQLCSQHPEWNSDGDRLCIPDPRCYRPADCLTGESCWPFMYDGSLEGQCQPNRQPYPVGATCDEDDDHCQVFCMYGRCTEWCTVDEDCPVGMNCQRHYLCGVEPCRNPRETAIGTICGQTTRE